MEKSNTSTFAVIGGNGLIGKEITNILLSKNHSVICIDLEISAITHPNLHSIVFDITQFQNFEDFLHTNFSEVKLAGVVNCSYPRTKDWGASLSDISYGSFSENLNLHLNSYTWISKIFGDYFSNKKQKASLVNYSSIYGFLGPNPNLYNDLNMGVPFPYAPIKAGIINATKYLASIYGQKNIRFNCVSPGGVLDKQNPKFVARYSNITPLGRLATPYEAAAPAIFLLSEESSYITGHNLIVDGGYSIR